MQFLLLPLLVLQTAFTSGPPNFYPSMLTAKEAARVGNKEMLIFFGTKSCLDCLPAWKAFEADAKATGQYVSTKMDAEDFDGKIVFEKYGLRQVPAWVIVAPGDKIKESWSGGWKDASGQPTVYATRTSDPPNKELTTSSTARKDAIQTPKTKTSSEEKTEGKDNSSTPERPASHPPKIDPGTPALSEGFVLQAGYFGSAANAEKLIADLRTKNLSPFTARSLQQNGSTFYRVISSIYLTEGEAQTALSHLTTAGFKATIKKTQDIQ